MWEGHQTHSMSKSLQHMKVHQYSISMLTMAIVGVVRLSCYHVLTNSLQKSTMSWRLYCLARSSEHVWVMTHTQTKHDIAVTRNTTKHMLHIREYQHVIRVLSWGVRVQGAGYMKSVEGHVHAMLYRSSLCISMYWNEPDCKVIVSQLSPFLLITLFYCYTIGWHDSTWSSETV